MFDNLKKIFCSDKEVKLAVIGPTSSGKTYFLTDFVTALKRLGYEEVNHFDSDIFHYPISSFIADVQNAKSGVEKTPIFICRNTNQYSSLYVNRDNRKHKVMIDFVDVPGEVVTKQIEVFPTEVVATGRRQECAKDGGIYGTESPRGSTKAQTNANARIGTEPSRWYRFGRHA